MVRPNLPDRTESAEIVASRPEGLVGNRRDDREVDARGSTYDVYFPTVGLHSDVRPAEGDLPQSRSHFRAIVGGLAVGRRLDWFTERLSWESFQHYQGATNLLVTELTWRSGPIRVWTTDFMAMGDGLPRTAGGTESPGQYLKRFRVKNEGTGAAPGAVRRLYPGRDQRRDRRARAELARRRPHPPGDQPRPRRTPTASWHATRPSSSPWRWTTAARCTASRPGPTRRSSSAGSTCRPASSVTVDLLVSGAFTGWRGDPGTFEHWLRPALAWFRAADLDQIEQTTAQAWDDFVEPLPTLNFPEPSYAVGLRRSALAIALHADATWGAIASGFDRGLSAYCWPARRDLGRRGDGAAGPSRDRPRGLPSGWRRSGARGGPIPTGSRNTRSTAGRSGRRPAVDQTALIPWAPGAALPPHRRPRLRRRLVADDRAGRGASAAGTRDIPGLHWIEELSLVSSAGIGNLRFGAFLYSNACVVAGLSAAARLARALGKPDPADRWEALAERIWEAGILAEAPASDPNAPGMVDAESGRFLRGTPALEPARPLDRPARVPGGSTRTRWRSACSAPPSRSGSCPPPTPGSAPPPRRSCRTSGGSPAPPTSCRVGRSTRRPPTRSSRLASCVNATSRPWPRSGWPAT